jgi:uncharacterized protein (TIGR03000 family)
MSYGGCYGMSYGGCYGGAVMPSYPAGTVVPGGTMVPGTDSGKTDGTKKKGTEEEQGAIDRPASATLIVNLPADAKLTVDGVVTKSTSAVRRFSTPPLEPGKEYGYTLRAEIPNDGPVEVVTKRVVVRAGQETRTTLALPISTARAR